MTSTYFYIAKLNKKDKGNLRGIEFRKHHKLLVLFNKHVNVWSY